MTRRQNNYDPPEHTFKAPDLSYLTINPGETLESLECKMRIASNIRQNIQNFAADLDRKLKAITEAAFESVKRITIKTRRRHAWMEESHHHPSGRESNAHK